MKTYGLLAVPLLAIAFLGGVGGCDDSCYSCYCDEYGSTRLIVINNSRDTVLVEVDEHADGDIDVGATLAPGTQADWVLDAGWTVVFVDGDGTEICLENRYDGVFEIADD
jgi:hypothetical protein